MNPNLPCRRLAQLALVLGAKLADFGSGKLSVLCKDR